MEQNSTATETQVTTTEQPASPVTPTETKQQRLDRERAEKRRVKQAEKDAKKAANLAKRADGVIGTIRSMLEQPTGTSRKETLDALTAKFPTRDPLGMAVTVGIQFSRLAKTLNKPIGNYKHATRGRVYGFEATLVRPAVVVEGTPAEPVVPTETTEVAAPVAQVETPAAEPVRLSKAERKALARAGK
jgi:hypothetical protein